MRNHYFLLKWNLFWKAVFGGKITWRKLWNAALCNLSYLRRTPRSGAFPYVLSLETGNECNANCLFCRDAKGVIHDANPAATAPGGIQKGMMPVDMALDLIDQAKDDALITVLYTNGEPLLYKELPRLVKACSEKKLLSMIATNGLLLNEQWAEALLDGGIDFIKLQLSGFTQETYGVQVRNGNVEKLKANIRMLAQKKAQKSAHTILMLDYILYSYNRHELPMARDFCRDLGIMFNVRPGNPRGGLEDRESLQSEEALPLKISCIWLWTGMQVNFNGDVLMCCDGVVFSGLKPYARFEAGRSRIRDIWNGPESQATRRTITQKGRGAIPVCAQCYRKDIAFKW